MKCLVRGGCQFGGWNQVTTDSDKHWPFLQDVVRALYGNTQFAIRSARPFSVLRRVPVSKFEEDPGEYNVQQIKT